MAAAENAAPDMVDPAIFERLQQNIDDDAHIREELRDILQKLERQGKSLVKEEANHKCADRSYSKNRSVHSRKGAFNPSGTVYVISPTNITLAPAWPLISEQGACIKELSTVASKHPYYKYNQIWTRNIQETVTIVLFCVWLGGGGKPQGSLPTIEEVGSTLNGKIEEVATRALLMVIWVVVPTNVKDRDTFHITTEEYLHALISLIEELARLAVNSVTLGDYQRPLQISKFVKDIHAGFQILNLKNDSLRRRSDSIKYNVKKIEDVVYDLSLRNLVPKPQESEKRARTD
ncbi:MAG: hypothetical protein Q9208_008392 [Pyrenodesmia sp. 3 TL-2023]